MWPSVLMLGRKPFGMDTSHRTVASLRLLYISWRRHNFFKETITVCSNQKFHRQRENLHASRVSSDYLRLHHLNTSDDLDVHRLDAS